MPFTVGGVTTPPGGSDTQVQFNDGGVFGGDAGLTFNKTTNELTLTGTGGVILSNPAAARLQLGSADAAAPVAQTLSVQSVVAGTSNTAGVDWTLQLSRSTGSAAGGNLVITGSPADGAGSTQNAALRLFDLRPTRTINFYNTYTDESNYETFRVFWSSSVINLQASGAGTGGNRSMNISANGIYMRFVGSTQWAFENAVFYPIGATNTYDIGTTAKTVRSLYIGTSIVIPGAASPILTTSAAITSGAGAGAGTLTNAPAAGDPTAWIPINDNGTTRYIPAW